MTQQAVEQAIGKITTDAEFRARFFADPEAASWEAGLPLSPLELEALSALSRRAVRAITGPATPASRHSRRRAHHATMRARFTTANRASRRSVS